jgi:long-subunit fatty acid transport protein
MIKKFVFLFVLIPFVYINAQIDLTAGMGLNFTNTSSLKDYVNSNFAPADNRLSTFNSTIDFFLEGDYTVSENFQLGLEYDLTIFSYNSPRGIGGIYELSYNMHRPSLVAYYVIPGNGYKFKFGGGVGTRHITVTEKNFTEDSYSSTGVGFLLKVQGLTLLSENLYANIAFDLRFDFPGEPSNGNIKIRNNAVNENVKFTSLSAGIKLGVSYLF